MLSFLSKCLLSRGFQIILSYLNYLFRKNKIHGGVKMENVNK
jgi:hypothetical protein